MKQILLILTQALLLIRYKISYKGLDEISALLKASEKGCLFLPNHPAVVVDPLIVSVPLVRDFAVRPLIIEYMYYHPAFHWVVRMLNALAIPNFGTSFSPLKLKRAERALNTISKGLKAGDRFLIYPAGTTKFQAKEVVGGAFGVHQLVQENPDVPIVLVRITGLWGSSFSRAASHGAAPDTKKALQNGLWATIKNLLFFVPKRVITVEFELAGTDFPRNGSKQQFNRYLEEWYNKPFGPNGEPVSLVSYAFWKNEFLEIPERTETVVDISSVPDDIKRRVLAKVAALAKMAEEKIEPDQKLIEHLGLDSLDHAELVAFLESEFGVSSVAPESLTTVGSLFLFARDGKNQTESIVDIKKEKNFAKDRPHRRVDIPEATSIPEAFFNACDKKLFQTACADPRSGTMTYYRCKKVVLLLAEKLKTVKGDRIGILLPASNITYLLVLACQTAGKVPVMINWTVGGKHLDTVLEVSKIEVCLSSWAFLDALDAVDISGLEPILLMLEELKADISIADVIRASYKALTRIKVPSTQNEAVVLFTSGTESMPKGVPLTHKNILFDLQAAIERVPLYEDDMLLAMLPPFHSFGFSVTGLLPLLSRLPVVYYPNPTDSKALAVAIEKWSISVLCSAPTFLRNIFKVADALDTSTLRMVISGAERAPDELFSLMPKQVQFVEGYGITECAPVLSANVSGDKERGVGQPLKGISFKIADPENPENEKPQGEVGMILAKGPNIFSGYLNKAASSPFINGWYVTGDLGSLDSSGNLVISGRLKRFVKIGGEMISLGAIEESLMNQLGFQVAVATEGDLLGKVALVLFSSSQHEPQEINQLLRKGGFSNIVKIDRVVALKEIPQTATGKIAYRELDKLLEQKK